MLKVISRADLAAFLTSSYMDPEGELQEELQAHAAAILKESSAALFVYTDHENGDDPQVGYSEYNSDSANILPVTYRKDMGSYYGVTVSRHMYNTQSPKVFHCYLGGSDITSAPGYVITEAEEG